VFVLVISHVHFLRDALVATLRDAGDIEAMGAFSRDTVEAAIIEFPPEVIVVDTSHPEGMTLVTAVRARLPKVRVVVLSMRERDEDFLAWADIGIAGYLGADTSAGDLIASVRRTAAGEVVCPPRLTALLLSGFADHANDRATRDGIHALTYREHEVLKLVADGLPNKLIAHRLRVALPTVKNHVHSILDKWEVRSRGEAAARYRRQVQEGKSSSSKPTRQQASHVPHMTKVNGSPIASLSSEIYGRPA